ncbi:MAG TPA: hypothetical protein VK828_18660 [Terriglobales bacterium]|nr:hypothetical protein [Terriglobales bacterium]
MKIDGASQFEQSTDVGCLRDVESEELIVVKVAYNQVVDVAPRASQANCSKEPPAMSFRQVRYRSQKPNGEEWTRLSAGFRLNMDR